MLSKIRFCLVALAVSMVISSCAPGLGESISVSRIPEAENANSTERASLDWDVKVKVAQLTDARTDPAVGEFNGKKLLPQSDIGASVQTALENAFKAKGVKLSLFNAPTVKGSITQWKVSVKQGFPTTEVESAAALSLQVENTDHRVVYNATYSGEAYEKKPFFSKEKIEGVLGKAMEQAIAEAMNDQNFIGQLTQYSRS